MGALLKKGMQKTVEKAGKNTLMETTNGDDALVEGIISLWKITSKGQISKDKEFSFKYNMEFLNTQDGRMKLSLSNNKKIITLGMQKTANEEKSSFVTMLAWESANLKAVQIPQKLDSGLRKLRGKLIELKFVNKNKQLFVTLEKKE